MLTSTLHHNHLMFTFHILTLTRYHTLTPSSLHPTSSPPYILTPSHPHPCIPSHPHLLTPSLPHTLTLHPITSSSPHTLTPTSHHKAFTLVNQLSNWTCGHPQLQRSQGSPFLWWTHQGERQRMDHLQSSSPLKEGKVISIVVVTISPKLSIFLSA